MEYLFHTWGVSGHILNSVHDISIQSYLLLVLTINFDLIIFDVEVFHAGSLLWPQEL